MRLGSSLGWQWPRRGHPWKTLSYAVSVPGALACLRLVLQSVCDFFSPLVLRKEEGKKDSAIHLIKI